MPEQQQSTASVESNYFSRVSANRQSIVKNDNNIWSNSVHNNADDDIFSINLINDSNRTQSPGPLGIHVIPSYDANNQKDTGLIIQRIEPNGRVYKDGRLQIGDRIIEINKRNLLGVDFVQCQELLREAIMTSNGENGSLELRIARAKNNDNSCEIEEDNDLENKENDEIAQTFNPVSTNLSVLNTKKLGKKITVQLVKGPQGLGFKLAARDNCTPGEYSPIYIKNILPKGAAITDGRLQRGDRLLEVNQIDMTLKTLHEAVNILRNTKLGDCVEIVVSRQILPGSNFALPREINEPEETEVIKNDEAKSAPKRELITFEIALNDTGSAGLGVSVKGKTKRIEDTDNSVDLGIFVKTVINGGAASKDGRLKPNDQLININGFSLLGKSNEEAMLILREAMQVESRPGHIELTVSRKLKTDKVETKRDDSQSRQFVKIIHHNNRKADEVDADDKTARFNRDAPNRRSMSEKRVKLGSVPANYQQNKQRNQSIDPKRSQTVQIIANQPYTTQTLGRSVKHPTHISNSISQKISQIYSDTKAIERQDSYDLDENKLSKPNLVVQDQSTDSTPYYTEIKPMARKSASMESIPQNVTESKPKPARPVVNVYNKFGTVTGVSVQNRPSLLMNAPSQEADSSNSTSNRFRAVNRSFRTAVDKSLDEPIQINGPKPEGYVKRLIASFNKNDLSSTQTSIFRKKRFSHIDTQTSSEDTRRTDPLGKKQPEVKSKETKSLIGKFQNLFKSHHAKKQSNEEVNQASSNKQTVELVNFHKIESNPKFNSSAKPSIISKTQANNADVLIENDTLYTQYRPASCQPPAPFVQCVNQKPYFANRESLFYHSTDNHRMTYSQRQQQFIQEQQKMLRQQQKKFLEQQEKLKEMEESKSQIIYEQREIKNYEDLKSKKAHIKHSMPFNGSSQVHPVAELFNEVVNKFDRMNVNQMSTKSQPPMSDNYQKEFCSKTGYTELSGSGSSTMSSSSASSTSSTSVSDRHHFYTTNNQHSMLLQSHPAQV